MLKQRWFRALCRWRFYIIVLLLIQVVLMVYVVISGSMTSKIVSTVLQLVSLVVAVYVISRREYGVYKLMWVFLILLVPVFGGLFYLLFTFFQSCFGNIKAK